MTEAEMQSIMRRDAEAEARSLRARVVELEAQVRSETGKRITAWEAAQERITELEKERDEYRHCWHRDLAKAREIHAADEARISAAEQRVKRLEGALEIIANVARIESETVWQDGDDFSEISAAFSNIEIAARAALATSEAEVSHVERIESDKCECGADDYCVSATLIACRSCGRTWGRCNGKWVLDTTTEPGGGQ